MAITVKLLKVFALSFVLNLAWENAHAMLYTSHLDQPITECTLIVATLGDAIMLSVLALPFMLSSWWHARLWLIIPIGIVLAIAIELYALHAEIGRASCRERV